MASHAVSSKEHAHALVGLENATRTDLPKYAATATMVTFNSLNASLRSEGFGHIKDLARNKRRIITDLPIPHSSSGFTDRASAEDSIAFVGVFLSYPASNVSYSSANWVEVPVAMEQVEVSLSYPIISVLGDHQVAVRLSSLTVEAEKLVQVLESMRATLVPSDQFPSAVVRIDGRHEPIKIPE